MRAHVDEVPVVNPRAAHTMVIDAKTELAD
jgi:hypothetical protein